MPLKAVFSGIAREKWKSKSYVQTLILWIACGSHVARNFRQPLGAGSSADSQQEKEDPSPKGNEFKQQPQRLEDDSNAHMNYNPD